jgi:hypothetical protein
MTTSCPARHFDFTHVFVRPETWGASPRFDTIPSRDNRQAERSTASPPVSKCSTKRRRASSPAAAKLLQAFLAVGDRPRAQILAAFKQKVEGEIDEQVGLAFRESGLKRREIRRAGGPL